MVILLLVTLLGIAGATKTLYKGHSVYRMTPTLEQMKLLQDFQNYPGIDFWKMPFELGDNMDIMVSPEQRKVFKSFLSNNSIDFSISVDDVQELIDKESKYLASARNSDSTGDISFTRYHRHNEINDYLKKLASDYPNLVTLETIGKSYEGRDMIVIKISSGGSDNRPAILVDSGIHAREWITPEMSLFIINQLVQNNTANRGLTEALDWYILPVLNPDGNEYSHEQDRMWRRSRSPGPASHPECMGVDLNRNFDFKWRHGAPPCEPNYPGEKAATEPETKAFQNFVLSKRNIKLYLTFHSYSNYIFYPWSYTTSLPSDFKILKAVAEEANAAHVKAGGESYKIGISSDYLYVTFGNTMDYMKGVAGIQLSYAVELTKDTFFPPENLIEITVTRFFEAVRSFANHVKRNFKSIN